MQKNKAQRIERVQRTLYTVANKKLYLLIYHFGIKERNF